MASLAKRIKRLRAQAAIVIARDQELARKFDRLIGIPGIAEISAIQLLAELAVLDPAMTVRQWLLGRQKSKLQALTASPERCSTPSSASSKPTHPTREPNSFQSQQPTDTPAKPHRLTS